MLHLLKTVPLLGSCLNLYQQLPENVEVNELKKKKKRITN